MQPTLRLQVLWMLLAAVVLSACSEDAAVDSGGGDPGGDDEVPVVETRSFEMGVAGLIPRNWPEPSDADWSDLFAKIPSYGELWGVHTGWNEGELDDDGVPVVVEVAFTAARSGVEPYVALGVEPDRLTQEEADTYFKDYGEEFVAVCREIARRHLPEIFLIGIEINRFYEKSPDGFEHFLAVYAEAYDAIKDVSPATDVGSNFLFEYMRGAGSRSGAEHEPHWELLDRFGSRGDLVTFTLYPFLDYDRPADIPDDYLEAIAGHTGRPVMITETGWPSESVSGIEGSEAEQVAYLEAVLKMVDDVPLRALVWAFPHDIDNGMAGGLFDHISMRSNDGDAKAVFARWTELRERSVE